ncbi:LOW QUALITY PROTEIN: uncharacterized protein LOC119553303 [Drosophila subpulchrella]|uniref:LOW QUALITY PROTEIN: uncharacterized protein LOC119553303 n=1 Tax=Drosophila subpulchrella TaxID=1486046 RepID=UPI0018A19CA9|nr:LOW QUALITY PROTEIN: uncharacterized protein LOC119553303 [Drosophila subpulchrella]
MSYGFIPLNSFGKLLLLLQEEPRGSSLWKTTTNRATKTKKGRRNHKVVLNKLKKRIGGKKERKSFEHNLIHSVPSKQQDRMGWVLGSGQPVRLGRGKKASREKAGKPESKSQQQDGQ